MTGVSGSPSQISKVPGPPMEAASWSVVVVASARDWEGSSSSPGASLAGTPRPETARRPSSITSAVFFFNLDCASVRNANADEPATNKCVLEGPHYRANILRLRFLRAMPFGHVPA